MLDTSTTMEAKLTKSTRTALVVGQILVMTSKLLEDGLKGRKRLNHGVSDFKEHFNTGKPYHGAVSYGYKNGTVSL
jgi:hypothetical protein